jgi:hypothetical protein
MGLTLNPTTGQFLGDFIIDVDGDNLRFTFVGGSSETTALVEGGDLHLALGNLIKPEKPKPLLPDGIINLENAPIAFPAAPQPIELTSDDDLLALAKRLGPLFGGGGVAQVDGVYSVICEPIKAWQIAAKNINFAMRAKAVLDNRSTDDWLDDELYFMYYDFGKEGFTWMAFKRFFGGLPKPYKQSLTYTAAELKGLFQPVGFSDGAAQLTEWRLSGPAASGNPTLKTSFTTSRALQLPEDRKTYLVSNQYMRSTPANNQTRLSLTTTIMQSLIKLHTYRVRYGWYSDIYSLNYNNLLERLWHNVGVGASQGKLGICQHCGRLFNADTERKDRKLYCSLYCQEAAKSKRHYCKRVVRDFIKQKDSIFSVADVLEKHPSLDRSELQDTLTSLVASGKITAVDRSLYRVTR